MLGTRSRSTIVAAARTSLTGRLQSLVLRHRIVLNFNAQADQVTADRVIDHLLETPLPEGPVELNRPHVLFEFADPELESLSSGQKLLIRMGVENAMRTKQTLEALRARIATAN